MVITGKKLHLPPLETCPNDPQEREAWEYFRGQVFNILQITMDYCQSKLILITNKRIIYLLVVTLKNEEVFTIDYFLHMIEASCWEEFINEFFIKREEVEYYESKHGLAMMRAYSMEFFEGINFQPKNVADVDF